MVQCILSRGESVIVADLCRAEPLRNGSPPRDGEQCSEYQRNKKRLGFSRQHRCELSDEFFKQRNGLRRGGVPSETMPCEFYRRSLDNIMNQVLCAGLWLSVAIAKSPQLKSKCHCLADTFAQSVTEKALDHRLIADAKRGLNRLNAHYENVITIIEILYTGISERKKRMIHDQHDHPMKVFCMKVFCIFIMVVGILSLLIAIAFTDRMGAVGIVWGLIGSSLFGSGVISLAITQALEKKP